jgi:biopolymer transport protein ExbB/TolQ
LAEADSKKNHIARVLLAGLKEREFQMSRLPATVLAKYMSMAMDRATLIAQHDYEEYLGVVDAVGRTAPFIGVLGGTPFTLAIGTGIAVPCVGLERTCATRHCCSWPR